MLCFFFIFAESLTMKKEIGKWFLDIAKYVTTAVVISSFLGSFEQKWAMYTIATSTIVLTFVVGVFIIKLDKKNNKTKKK